MMFAWQIGEEYCRLDPHYKEPLQVIVVAQSCHSHQSVPISRFSFSPGFHFSEITFPHLSHLTEGGLLSQSLCNLAPAKGGSEDHRWHQQDNEKEELRKIIFRIHVWAFLLLLWGSITKGDQPNLLPPFSCIQVTRCANILVWIVFFMLLLVLSLTTLW